MNWEQSNYNNNNNNNEKIEESWLPCCVICGEHTICESPTHSVLISSVGNDTIVLIEATEWDRMLHAIREKTEFGSHRDVLDVCGVIVKKFAVQFPLSLFLGNFIRWFFFYWGVVGVALFSAIIWSTSTIYKATSLWFFEPCIFEYSLYFFLEECMANLITVEETKHSIKMK